LPNIPKYQRCGKTSKFLKVAVRAAKGAGNLLLNLKEKKLVTYKKDLSLLTQADLISEKFIKKELKKAFPKYNVLSEEAGFEEKKSDYTWIIDPIDGTTNYFRNLSAWCISIGLVYKNEVIVAVIYDPVKKELFYAEKNKGAYLNGIKLKVSEKKGISSAVISLERTRSAKERAARNYKSLAMVATTRMLGSTCLELCYLAAGREDAMVGIELLPWDRGTGLLIAEEAGAKVVHIDKGKDIFSPQTFVAANSSKLAKEISKLVV